MGVFIKEDSMFFICFFFFGAPPPIEALGFECEIKIRKNISFPNGSAARNRRRVRFSARLRPKKNSEEFGWPDPTSVSFFLSLRDDNI